MRQCSHSSVLHRTKLLDPLVLFEPKSLRTVLQKWLSQLEKTFALNGSADISSSSSLPVKLSLDVHLLSESEERGLDEDSEEEKRNSLGVEETGGHTACESVSSLSEPLGDIFRVYSPYTISNSLQKDLAELTALCLELGVLTSVVDSTGGHVDCALQQLSPEVLACRFLKKNFFLLDLKRARESIKLSYTNSPCVWDTFVEGLKGNSQMSLPLVEVFYNVEA